MKYKRVMGNFDVVPDHATMAHVGKFVAFVRSERDKFCKGEQSLITPQEIEKLDLVKFEWRDIGIHKLRKRKRGAPIDGVGATSATTATSSSPEAMQKKRAVATFRTDHRRSKDQNNRAKL